MTKSKYLFFYVLNTLPTIYFIATWLFIFTKFDKIGAVLLGGMPYIVLVASVGIIGLLSIIFIGKPSAQDHRRTIIVGIIIFNLLMIFLSPLILPVIFSFKIR